MHAQHFLYLKKDDSAKRKIVNMYDIVKVKTYTDSTYMGSLNDMAPDMLIINDRYIKLEDVKALKTYNMLGRGVGKSLQYGGAFFAAIFVTNSLINGYRPLLTEGNYYFIGGLIIAGVILELISSKWHRFDKGWKTEVIIMDEL